MSARFEKEGGIPSEPPPSFQASQMSQSPAKTQPPLFRTQFACITLNMDNLIRLINFPEPEMITVEAIVKRTWPRGIRTVKPYGQSRQIKVDGWPWACSSNGNDDARRLVLRIIEGLYDLGWVMQAAIDFSNKSLDKEWISISFDLNDKLKIVDAPPRELTSAILDTFRSCISRHVVEGNRLKIHFTGSPWWPHGEATVATRLMLLTLVEVLERFGFSIYASIDQFNGSQEHETDVLVCHRQRDWVPGAPIWHR